MEKMAGPKGDAASDDFSGKAGKLELNRCVYIRELVDQILKSRQIRCGHKASKMRDLLAATLLDTLKELEGRFHLYGEKLASTEEVSQLEKTENLFSNIEARLVANEHTFARNNSPSHLYSDAMRHCLPRLSKDLDLQGSCLLDELIASNVLSISDEESIRGKGSRRLQSEELMNCMMGRMSADQFHQVLLPALTRDHPHLAECLLCEVDRLEEEEEEKQCIVCRVRNTVQVKRLATPLLIQGSINVAVHADLRSGGLSNNSKWFELRSVPESAIIEAMKTKYPVFYREFKEEGLSSLMCSCRSTHDGPVDYLDVCCKYGGTNIEGQEHLEEMADVNSDMTRGTTEDDLNVCLYFEEEDLELVYKMTARPRGICLIINNVEIKGHFRRSWSIGDAKKLADVFEKMEFTVVTKTDLKSIEMKNTLQEYADFNHTRCDAFVCCILTCGDKDGLCGADGKFIKLSSLTSKFRASQCPTLAGKPKLFFSIANRGHMHMTGLRSSPSESQPYSRYIADEADFLIGHSTSPDNKSFWHQTAGSDYVNALTKTLGQKWEE